MEEIEGGRCKGPVMKGAGGDGGVSFFISFL